MVESPFLLAQKLERQLVFHLARLDRDCMSPQAVAILDLLKREMTDARLDIRDYELSETRAEQLAKAKDAKQRLASVSTNILLASEQGMFGAADVAHISAQLEQIGNKIQ